MFTRLISKRPSRDFAHHQAVALAGERQRISRAARFVDSRQQVPEETELPNWCSFACGDP